MSEAKIGAVLWQDLTVENAVEVKDFYAEVVGWQAQAEDMGGYSDYSMMPQGEAPVVAGICHARGSNAGVPPHWLIYISVENVENSVEKCVALGGKVIDGPRSMGKDLFAVIQDPAGAVCALYETKV